MSFSRPQRGLRPAEALARWSDPALYAELIRLAGTKDLPQLDTCGHVIRDRDRCSEYQKKRTAVEADFHKLLRDGEVLSSAIAKFGPGREVLHPSLYDLMVVAHNLDEIVGNGMRLQNPEFFALSEVPLNIVSIPNWLDAELGKAGLNAFRHSPDYRHIHLHGNEFCLSPLHANIVRVLREAFLAGEPWMHGKTVLERAGSDQTKLGDVFKSREDWKMLIDSDGKGMYRLRMEPPTGDADDR